MTRFYIFIGIIIYTLVGCKSIQDFQVSYKTEDLSNYGDTVNLKFENIFANDEKSEFSNRHFRFIKGRITGGSLEKNQLIINKKFLSKNIDTIYLDLEYDVGDRSISKKVKVPLRYDKELKVDFSGADGKDQNSKMSRVFGRLISRDGRVGKTGDKGGNGQDGEDIEVRIAQSPTGLFWVEVATHSGVETSKYYYKYEVNTEGLKFISNGGNGGKGGDGGDGSDGEDGEIKNDKLKAPGAGGNGGVGGDAGNGGNGGSVMVYIHPNAKALMSKINIENNGGNAGIPGNGGEGGEAGVPLEGQDQPEDGAVGNAGNNGEMGQPGQNASIIIKEFDTSEWYTTN